MQISDLSFDALLNTRSQVYHFYIPNYQREYVWNKNNWEILLDDILENPIGHFMGTIICLKRSVPHGCDQVYDIVDGQQRLTTLSILLMAIFRKYKVFEISGERKVIRNIDDIEDYLIRNKDRPYTGEIGSFNDNAKTKFLRVKPSTQRFNLTDYIYLLYKIGIIIEEPEYENNMGNRTLTKAFRFFEKNIPNSQDELEDLFDKIQNLLFIHISADEPAMAYRMFETLNNRGVPLTPVDIIKNQILSKLATRDLNDDYAFNKWKKLIHNLTEDNEIRFFRQYYNIYQFFNCNEDKEDPDYIIKTDGLKKATKSNLTHAFKKAMDTDVNWLLDDLIIKATIYGKLYDPDKLTETEASQGIKEKLRDLRRILAAPAYATLMLIWHKQLMEPGDFEKTVGFLVKYFLRRNLTDTPPTRDLDNIQIEMAQAIFEKIKNNENIEYQWYVDAMLLKKFAGIDELEEILRSGIYSENYDMARFILIKIEETQHTREYKPDLWERNERGKFLWTIEHVFPQSDNIKEHWIDLIASGNKIEAERILNEKKDNFGNLTLSAYNSKLSDSSFKKKQGKTTQSVYGQKLEIGYKNGLYLNSVEYSINGDKYNLANSPTWNEDHIDQRTNVLVGKIIELFKFDFE